MSLEPESTEGMQKRRRKQARQALVDSLLAVLFAISVFAGNYLLSALPGGLGPWLAIALPVVFLSVWWWWAHRLMKSPEFEREIALKALLLATVVTLWLATGWSIATEFASAPALSGFLLAPIAALLYGLFSFFILRRMT